MKQRKDGEKIINWHKPLGRSQLRQRYLRHRHEDVKSAKPWLSAMRIPWMSMNVGIVIVPLMIIAVMDGVANIMLTLEMIVVVIVVIKMIFIGIILMNG